MENKYVKYIILGVASIYLISVIERMISKDTSPTNLLMDHAVEKARLQTTNDVLNAKIHDYEIQLLKINSDINNLTHDQIDSTWASIFE